MDAYLVFPSSDDFILVAHVDVGFAVLMDCAGLEFVVVLTELLSHDIERRTAAVGSLI